MGEAETLSQSKRFLYDMINSIEKEIGMEEKNQVLIAWRLDTDTKIQAFFEWIKKNLKDGKLQATEEEIVRAAVHAS